MGGSRVRLLDPFLGGFPTGRSLAWECVMGRGEHPADYYVLTGISLVPEHKAVDYHGVPGRRLRAGPGEV